MEKVASPRARRRPRPRPACPRVLALCLAQKRIVYACPLHRFRLSRLTAAGGVQSSGGPAAAAGFGWLLMWPDLCRRCAAASCLPPDGGEGCRGAHKRNGLKLRRPILGGVPLLSSFLSFCLVPDLFFCCACLWPSGGGPVPAVCFLSADLTAVGEMCRRCAS